MGLLFRPGAPQHLSIFSHDLSMFISTLSWYTIYTVKGTRQETTRKEFQKKIKKVLDKRSRLCYNKDVPRGTKQIATCGIQQEKEVFYE